MNSDLEGMSPNVKGKRSIEAGSLRQNQDNKDELYSELWHACAGPLVYVPQVGDKVFYFPQGHMEQVAACMSQENDIQLPIHNLPSMILCRVVNVHLKAELNTDEVFAQVALLPETMPEEPTGEYQNYQSNPQTISAYSFCKTLTASDTSAHGGFSVLKRHADECLPPLDMSQQTPSQDLLAKDLHGLQWRFRHIYRGQPKRHLLTSGWSTFVSSKKLVTGDGFIFLRGSNGALHVGIRRAMNLQKNASASVISGQSMLLGVLETASHALSTMTMFSVYYRPRASPFEFIIPYDKYMKSMGDNYSVGMSFEMKFEGEECLEENKIAGIIVGIEAIDHLRWPGSQWKCFKVQWDKTSTNVVLPNRVSPWNIEPLTVTTMKHHLFLPRSKRARAHRSSSPKSPLLVGNGFSPGSSESAPPQRHSRVLQGQELWDICGNELGQSNSDWRYTQMGLDYILSLHPGNMSTDFGLNENWSVTHPVFNTCEFQERVSHEPIEGVSSLVAQPKSNGTCIIFGVDLGNISPPVVSYGGTHHPSHVSPVTYLPEISEFANESGRFSEKICMNCCSIASRSCTKVHKYGIALGRSVDLGKFDGYNELLHELDRMFDFDGKLIDTSNGWYVVYTDDEGDKILHGDYPWQKFRTTVQKMIICPKEEVDKLIQCSR